MKIGLMALMCVVCVFAIATQAGGKTQDLIGMWNLVGTDEGGAPLRCAIAVPGGVYAALLRAGVIPDPYYGQNERLVQWPRRKDWMIERDFELDGSLLASESVVLRLEDVDTFARISINGSEVGECSNRFRRWDFDVKRFLKPGRNRIVGLFRSAEIESERLAARYAEKYTCQNVTIRNMPLIRKPQCHAGWDWGLTLMDAGFFGDVKLIGTDLARIDYSHCDQKFSSDFSLCEVLVNVDVFSPLGGEAESTVRLGDIEDRRMVKLDRGMNRIAIPVRIENPHLWWPVGQGDQVLYDLFVRIGDDVWTRKIGLRTVELITEDDRDPVSGREARSFGFRINGRDVFCKGCNWIPCDALEDRQTPERYVGLLRSAVMANMNMVRVWGGGKFEKDCFYEDCDKFGLLVWHDLMFACGTYPTDDNFLDNVSKELEHQIRRLKNHPSIVLWSGDNECYGVVAWDSFPEINDATRDVYFRKIAERGKHNGEIVKRLDPTRPWWPSSPGSSHKGYTEDFADFEKGDNHFWGIWFRNEPFETLYGRRPRFTDEFGYQSFPSVETALTFADAEDINFTSPTMEAHQKCRAGTLDGTRCILHAMSREFRMPDSAANMFWLSQVLQCEALTPGLRYWRALRPYCMGMCVWQLNDNWPAISWSTIEYGGKWKQVMYRIKRMFAPTVVVPFSVDGGKTIEIWAVNDLPCSAKAKVCIVTRSFDGREVMRREAAVESPSASSTIVARIPADRFGDEEARKGRYVTVECEVESEKGVFKGCEDWFFAPFKSCPLEKADVRISASEENGAWTVELLSDKPAFYVWVESTVRGEFDDNSLTLNPHEARRITFYPNDRTKSFADFKKGLSVRHLRETYRGVPGR